MVDKAKDSFERAGSYICTYLKTLDNVLSVADRSCKYLCLIAVGVIYIHNLCYKTDTVGRDVIKTTYEW